MSIGSIRCKGWGSEARSHLNVAGFELPLDTVIPLVTFYLPDGDAGGIALSWGEAGVA